MLAGRKKQGKAKKKPATGYEVLEDATFSQTSRNSMMVVDGGGYDYVFAKYSNEDKNKKIWRCRMSWKLGCKARIHTIDNTIIYRTESRHTHEPENMESEYIVYKEEN